MSISPYSTGPVHLPGPAEFAAETAQWSQPASEQTINLPGLDVMLTVNQDGTIAVELFTRDDFDPAQVCVTLDDGELS